MWIRRAVLIVVIPQHFSYVRHAHWGTWVSAFSLLNGIHAQCSDGIGTLFSGHSVIRHFVSPSLMSFGQIVTSYDCYDVCPSFGSAQGDVFSRT
jgi:hypothetical protein